MDNDAMKPGRFLKLQTGRRKMAWIAEHISAGHKIMVCTYTRATIYKSVGQFQLGKSGSVYAQHGRRWDCIDGCALRAQTD